jgi:hypothetical protein
MRFSICIRTGHQGMRAIEPGELVTVLRRSGDGGLKVMGSPKQGIKPAANTNGNDTRSE